MHGHVWWWFIVTCRSYVSSTHARYYDMYMYMFMFMCVFRHLLYTCTYMLSVVQIAGARV